MKPNIQVQHRSSSWWLCKQLSLLFEELKEIGLIFRSYLVAELAGAG
jgi:hypothetical protein